MILQQSGVNAVAIGAGVQQDQEGVMHSQLEAELTALTK